MNYIMFNNEVMVSNGEIDRQIKKGQVHFVASGNQITESLDTARICVVDVDVLISAAVEFPIEKKDNILVRKFNEFYHYEDYIIQDERIDNNLFQVIGIKERKVREVYSLIPPEKVEGFIPYGIALRNTLINRKVSLNRTVVFVDVIKNEKLLTVFDGLKFSRTRVITSGGEDILPEIKRSQIDFFKKIEDYLSKKPSDFVVVVNDQDLVQELSKNKEKIQIEYLDSYLPGMEGLINMDSSIKYRLPEEILRKRKEIELKKNIRTTVVSLSVVAVGLFYFLFNKVELRLISNQCDLAQEANQRLDEKLTQLDKETYREDLRLRKSLSYGIAYLRVLDLIPSSYLVDSFKFIKTNRWNLELTLSSDNGTLFDSIPKVRILKNAEIKDIFVNDQPGKHLRITL